MGYRELPSSLGVALTEMEELRVGRGSVGGARLRLLPAQQARRVGELPQPRHAVRAQDLPVSVASDDANVESWPNPRRSDPSCPASARLGLVEPPARADLDRLGWNTDAHVELLWSLSRAPDADAALRTMVRLADATRKRLGRTEPRAGQGPRAARPAVRRARFLAGTRRPSGRTPEVVASARGQRHAAVRGRSFADDFAAVAECPTDASSIQPSLRILYRDRMLVLAALDVAPTVENEPVLPFPTVGEHLADLADAALGAALIVATRTVCGDDTPPPRLAVIAMGKCGARELNYVSDVDVIFVAETRRRHRHPGRRRDDAVGASTPSSRSTRRCGRRASTVSWSGPSSRTSPTTSGGPRPGSSRRCSRPAPRRVTPNSARSTWRR